jgi:hypothetical protein
VIAVVAISARWIMARQADQEGPPPTALGTRIEQILRAAEDKDEATQRRAEQEALDLIKEAKRRLSEG